MDCGNIEPLTYYQTKKFLEKQVFYEIVGFCICFCLLTQFHFAFTFGRYISNHAFIIFNLTGFSSKHLLADSGSFVLLFCKNFTLVKLITQPSERVTWVLGAIHSTNVLNLVSQHFDSLRKQRENA